MTDTITRREEELTEALTAVAHDPAFARLGWKVRELVETALWLTEKGVQVSLAPFPLPSLEEL